MSTYTHNPNGADESTLPRIYCFANGANGFGWNGAIYAQDGTRLGGHTSSREGWLFHDLGIGEGSHYVSRRAEFAKHYPDGYVAEWVSYADAAAHPELQRIFAEINAKQTVGAP
jgi:hypothetical protein